MIYSQDLNRVIDYAKENASERKFKEIDTDILFNALICHSNLAIASLFGFFDQDVENVFTISEIKLTEKPKGRKKNPQFNEEVKKVLKDAEAIATFYKQEDVRPEMVLAALSSNANLPFVLERVFEEVDQKEFVAKIVEFLNDIGDFNFCEMLDGETPSQEEMDMFVENRILDQFATNLNVKAKSGEFDNLIEYDDTIQKLATILCKKTKPNAILVGSSGAGKTSIIEMLARQIVSGDAPELLSNKVIYSVNLSSMVAGTQFRGQFEERLQRFVEEAKKWGNVILFIDEIHTLVGAGGSGSNKELEASNMLKPALARGEISCIGATTAYEYNQTIKSDAALDRRFEKVFVTPPSSFQMKKILPELIKYYSKFHCAEYKQDFCDNLIYFCDKYMPNRSYPDKAVDVIDHCGAMAKVAFFKMPSNIKNLKEEISSVISSVEEVFDIQDKLDEFKKECSTWEEKCLRGKIEIDASHLRNFFKTRLNPLCNPEIIENITFSLKDGAFGKDREINLLKKGLSQESLQPKNSPISVLFYGEKGSGKTFLAKKIAEFSRENYGQVFEYNGVEFDDRRKILGDRFDADSLAQKIIMQPNSIVIIDDFDKADFQVTSIFQQIFKEGKLVVGGETVDFTNTVFILFSPSSQSKKLGFGGQSDNSSSVEIELRKQIKIKIEISPINEDNLKKIVKEMVGNLRMNIENCVEIDNDLVEKIVSDSLKKEDKFEFIEEQIVEKIMPILINS